MYPGKGPFPDALSVGVPQRIDREMYFLPVALFEQLELALDVLEFGGIFAGWFGRFSRLNPERQLEAIEAMLDHSWQTYRQVATALTQLVKGMYYADRATWQAIGYDGPWMPPKIPASIAQYPAYPELAERQYRET